MEQNNDKNKTKTLGKGKKEGKKNPKAIIPSPCAFTCGLVTLSYHCFFFSFFGGEEGGKLQIYMQTQTIILIKIVLFGFST